MRLRVLQISAADVIGTAELLARIGRLVTLPAAARARYAVQLRDPALGGRALAELGRQLRELTRRVGARLLVNDRLDLGALVEADGVHLGRRSVTVSDARRLLGEAAWVSVSAHDLDDVRRGGEAGADAVLLSPIFASPGKAPPLGLGALSAARRLLPARVQLVALGGIDAASVGPCLAAGADAVATIRADLARAALLT